MITETDIIELQGHIEKFYKKLLKSQRKTTSDVIGILNALGDRLASHYDAHGFQAYYRLPNTDGQIIRVMVDMNAEEQFKLLPDYYKKEE